MLQLQSILTERQLAAALFAFPFVTLAVVFAVGLLTTRGHSFFADERAVAPAPKPVVVAKHTGRLQ